MSDTAGSPTQEITDEHEPGNTRVINDEEEDAGKIYGQLGNVNLSKIILTGEIGSGKTWIAKQIKKYVVRQKHDEPIWISLDQKQDEQSLFDTIARQFSLPTSTDAREVDGQSNRNEESEKERRELNEKRLKEKMEGKLHKATPEKFLLLVLDGQLGENDEEKEKMVFKILGLENGTGDIYKGKFKVLITRRRSEAGDHVSDEGLMKKVEIEPLPENEATKLLEKNVFDQVKEEYSQALNDLSNAIRKKKVLPAEILILAGTLNHIAKDKSGNWDLKLAFEAATNDLKQLLRYTYDKEPGNCLIDCFWHSWHFLEKHGGIHYNELITNWIMEGHLKPIKEIDKAYQKGHDILMQLIDCHMLKMQEDNVVVLEGAILNMNEYCCRGYTGKSDPGLASVLKDYDPRVLEGIKPADGMMKTLCSDKKEDMIASLLIDGGRLCREVHEVFFGAKQNLNLLAIFDPRLKSLDELSVSKMKKLLVFMLRGAYLLKDINQIEKLKDLTVLEISGSKSLETKLEKLPIVKTLKNLEILLLKGCSGLAWMRSLKNVSTLKILDLSGAGNIKEIMFDSFEGTSSLKELDLSGTLIQFLPSDICNLQKLRLKGCSLLKDVPELGGGSNMLEELDLSGCESLVKLPVLTDLQKLKILNLQNCSKLESPPDLKSLTNLEKLDLRGTKLWSKDVEDSLKLHIPLLQIVSDNNHP
ncbi:Disease resistance protein [Corchorus olitorius]|uniref:Disease resistance protein n=1 Tax=Corchorus olitorius TaxID=93759 RepID=A0A1R3JF39_9ROSI|nr:Disease resistance protein [Corchorus olitorius]